MKRLLSSADDHGFGIFPPWIFGVDVVIKQGAKEMVDLMLQADGRIAGCPDADVFPAQQVIAFYRDARMTVDEAFVFLQDGQAALALCEIGVLLSETIFGLARANSSLPSSVGTLTAISCLGIPS